MSPPGDEGCAGKTGHAVVEVLESLLRGLYVYQDGLEKTQERHNEFLKTHSESIMGLVEAVEPAQLRPAPVAISVDALDNWRNDCIRCFEATLAKARPMEAAGSFKNFTTILNSHGTRIDELKVAQKKVANALSVLSGDFDRNARQLRLWRLAWVSPLVLLSRVRCRHDAGKQYALVPDVVFGSVNPPRPTSSLTPGGRPV